MNHSDVQSRMADYLDGDLELDERALVDAHLDACDSCAGDLSELQGTVALLRSLPTPETPPGLADTVIERLRAGEANSRWDEFKSGLAGWLTPPRMLLPATALAATALVVLVAGDQLQVTGLIPGPKSPARDASPQPTLAKRVRPTAPSPARAARPVPPAELAALHGTPAQVPQPEPLLNLARQRPVLPPRAVFGSSRFGSAQSLVRGGPNAGLQPVTVVQLGSRTPLDGEKASVKRERQLDQRLELLGRDPAGFSGWLGSLSLAERELWIDSLATYALERGVGGAVLDALRSLDDLRGREFSSQFAAALEQHEAGQGDPSPER